jgi:pre-mRNA-splicing factor SYF1
MLRIKRSVQAQYNTDTGYVAAASGQVGAAGDANQSIDDGDPMSSLERNAPMSGFVESSTGPVGGQLSAPEVKRDTEDDTPMDNPDAIELGDDDDEAMGED